MGGGQPARQLLLLGHGKQQPGTRQHQRLERTEGRYQGHHRDQPGPGRTDELPGRIGQRAFRLGQLGQRTHADDLHGHEQDRHRADGHQQRHRHGSLRPLHFARRDGGYVEARKGENQQQHGLRKRGVGGQRGKYEGRRVHEKQPRGGKQANGQQFTDRKGSVDQGRPLHARVVEDRQPQDQSRDEPPALPATGQPGPEKGRIADEQVADGGKSRQAG